jgi:toxin ParE1/3/4
MKVLIEEEAVDDLDGIHAWIAKDNPASADSTIDRIFAEIAHLGRFPKLGHHGRARDTFEWVVTESSHVVVYEFDHDRDELRVVGVFRGSQQIRRL